MRRKLKKYISLFSVALIGVTLPIQVMAEEETEETWLEQQVKEKYSVAGFTLADVPDNSALLNVKYYQLQKNIEENGYGDNYEITLPDSIEISGNAAELFEKEYGDIDFSIEKIEIPDDFNAEDILQSSKDIVNTKYSDFVNSSEYQSIYNSVSTFQSNSAVAAMVDSSEDIGSIMNSSQMKALLNMYSLSSGSQDFYSTAQNMEYEASLAWQNIQKGHLDETSTTENYINCIKEQVKNGAQAENIDYATIAEMESLVDEYFGAEWSEILDKMDALFNGDNPDAISNEEFLKILKNACLLSGADTSSLTSAEIELLKKEITVNGLNTKNYSEEAKKIIKKLTLGTK